MSNQLVRVITAVLQLIKKLHNIFKIRSHELLFIAHDNQSRFFAGAVYVRHV
jgi:hypothetical protein